MKLRPALFILFIISSSYTFSQEKQEPVILNKKIEIVDYQYDYLYFEFFSSFSFSVSYPTIITDQSLSPRQQFFEYGRNKRPGIEFGFSQGLKLESLSLSLGIYLKQYNELFSYLEYTTQKVIVDDPNGLPQEILVVVGSPTQSSASNRLNYLKIPVGLAWFPKSLHQKIGLKTSFNFHYLLTADYLAKFSTTEPSVSLKRNDFNSSCLSVEGAMIFPVLVSKKISMQIEPYWDIQLNTTIRTNDFLFRMNTLGLRLTSFISY